MANTCKQALGVSFHDNMTVKDITETWVFRVPAIVKALNPTLDIAMTAAYAGVLAAEQLKQTKEQAEDTFKTVQDAVETASAVQTGNTGYAGAKASAAATDAASAAADTAVEQGKAQLDAQLDAFCAAQLAP